MVRRDAGVLRVVHRDLTGRPVVMVETGVGGGALMPGKDAEAGAAAEAKARKAGGASGTTRPGAEGAIREPVAAPIGSLLHGVNHPRIGRAGRMIRLSTMT